MTKEELTAAVHQACLDVANTIGEDIKGISWLGSNHPNMQEIIEKTIFILRNRSNPFVPEEIEPEDCEYLADLIQFLYDQINRFDQENAVLKQFLEEQQPIGQPFQDILDDMIKDGSAYEE